MYVIGLWIKSYEQTLWRKSQNQDFFATKFENIYISKNLGNKYTNQTTF